MTFLFLVQISSAQLKFSTIGQSTKIDYANPKTYEIAGITISGVKYLNEEILIQLTGLKVGDKIEVPGQDITGAIKSLWKQNLFADVKISVSKIQGNLIFLNIEPAERPRLSKFSFAGLKKGEADDIRDEIKLVKGKIVTDHLIKTTVNKINKFLLKMAT